MRPLAVFDIDGVLADVSGRVHFLAQRPPDWDAFFAALPGDAVHAQGRALATEAARECDVLYLTGRPERYRGETAAWLRAHHLPEGQLVMRPDGDRRPARTAKPALLAAAAAGRVVAVVVDDDLAVCLALERLGHRVLRADWADAAAPLTEAQETHGRT